MYHSMKKGDVIEGVISKSYLGDKGIIEGDDGVKIVLKGGIEKSRVRARITKKRSDRYEARILEVVESPLETREKSCEKYGVCGGCSYQKIPYIEQLRLKSRQAKILLDSKISYEYDYEGIIGSPIEWCFRNKMEFAFGDEEKGGSFSLGLHKRGHFHDIVNVADCKLVNEDYNKILRASRKYFMESGISFYNKSMHRGYLRHLLIRRAEKSGEILIALETSSDFITEKNKKAMATEKLSDFLASGNATYDKNKKESSEETKLINDYKDLILSLELEGVVSSILHFTNDSVADDVKAEKSKILYGRDFIVEELLGLRFKITPFSFFQTNSLGAELLYEKVREYVGNKKDAIVYDLYSGTGTISQLIARVSKKVIGIEIVEEAVKSAEENAVFNGIDNVKFIAGDVLKKLDENLELPDFIILDPPRDGVSKKALVKILSYGVDEIIYIACKPTSLVRDIPTFEEFDYRIKNVCLCDLFPQTSNVEMIAVFKKYPSIE